MMDYSDLYRWPENKLCCNKCKGKGFIREYVGRVFKCDKCEGTGLLDKATEIGRLRDELVKSLKEET